MTDAFESEMEPARKRKKRGSYKNYLNPGSCHDLPWSTAYRHQKKRALFDFAAAPLPSTSSDLPIQPHNPCQRDNLVDRTISDSEHGDNEPGLTEHVEHDSRETERAEVSEHAHEKEGEQPGACSSDSDECEDPGMGSDEEAEKPFLEWCLSLVVQKVVLSKGDIFLMILKYAIRHRLTFCALNNLIELINLIFEDPILPTSQYLLEKVFDEVGKPMRPQYYCSEEDCFVCIGDVGSRKQFECPKCKKKWQVSEAPFFILLDVLPQLKKVLKGCDLRDLTKPLGHADVLSDICDGTMYRDFDDATTDVGPRITFTLNADGTPLFKSSNTSIWPIQLIVNEIPAAERMKRPVLAALWFGREKPHMEMFQDVFVEDMKELSTRGFSFNYKGTVQVFRAFCICCAVDSVARAPMQGVTQFNGFYGCNWCLQEGERVGKAHKYPVVLHCPERTEQQMISDMESAVRDGGRPNGVRTVSPLINMPQFHIVWGFVPDYMHCMLLGVGRQFLTMWQRLHLNPDQRKEVDKRIKMLSPPKEVRRMPRPASQKLFWKAKEWENWILFFSLPVLEGLLDQKYFHHWAYFVDASYVLLQEKVSLSDLDVVEERLVHFHGYAQILYGAECMTFNMHQLLHLTKSVRQWGPLWARSAFPFEAGNGTLKEAVKAAKGIPHQICRMLQIDEVVNKLSEVVTAPRTVRYVAALDPVVSTKKSFAIRGEARFFGRGIPFSMPDNVVQSSSVLPQSAVQYSRMLRNGCMFTSSKYASGKRANNSVVLLADGSYAVLRNILCVKNSCAFVIVQKLKCTPLRLGSLVLKHTVKVAGHRRELMLLPLSELKHVCVFVKLNLSLVSILHNPYNL